MSEQIHDVNIQLGDDTSQMLYEAAKLSWENRPGAVVEMHPSFSGLRALHPDYKPTDCFESMGSDGIGTKVEIAERLKDHSTIAFDLFAMSCDDAVVRGAEPIAINTVLDVNKLTENDKLTSKAIKEIAYGYIAASKEAGVVILNGEVAELGDRVSGYGKFNYNWCATVLWYAQKDRLLTGHKIKPGQTVIGLAEQGFRSNGITDVRAAMAEQYGPEWHNTLVKSLGNLTLGKLVQRPSIIYSKLITELTGGFDINKEPLADITGVAHITGGGLPSKLGRMLEPSGHGVYIDSPQDPPEIMLHAQELRNFSDKKAYGKWHMGTGMVLVTSEPEKVLMHCNEKDFIAQKIGEVTDKPTISVKNMGAQKQENFLIF
jgi:phosphoribosylformylglycinamidine cyclo-ligase